MNTNMKRSRVLAGTKHQQRGVSMIELMVSLVIASFLIAGMVLIFLSGRASFVTQEQVGRLQENGRYAYQLIKQEIQNSGYHHEAWEPPQLGVGMTVNTVNGAGNSPDTLELQYESDKDCNGAFNTVTVSVTKPDGTAINVPAHYQRLVRFTVVNNQLIYTCSYGQINGALTQQVNSVVADGVENLQVQFGEDTNGNLSANNWVDDVSTIDLFNVVALRVAMVVATPEIVSIENDAQTYDLYAATTTAANDARIRRVYGGEITLRNATL